MFEPIRNWQPYADAFAADFNHRLTTSGLTLMELSARSGLAPSCLQQLAHARQLPNTKTIIRVAAVFGVPPDKLLEVFRPLMPNGYGKRGR
jgi:lambda repressor-like predicted transcriptional regulator